jgi:autotransporter-associated beta strand protein
VISSPVFRRDDGQISTGFGTVNLFNANALGPNSTLLRMESGTLNLNAIAATVGKFEGYVSSFFTGTSGTIFTVGDSTSANVTADFAGTIQNGVRLTKVGLGTQILSGVNPSNNTTAQYTVTGGTLRFAKTSALMNGADTNWTAAKIVAGGGATLAFNVGGTGEFTTGNVTTLLTNLGGLGGSVASGQGLQADSRIGFDTTNAGGGTFTVADAITDSTGPGGGAISLTKSGTGALVLTNANTYTGVTLIDDGILALGANDVLPNYSAVSLGAATLDAATFADTLGTLDVTGAATINLDSGATLAFAASNGINSGNWAGTLNITGTLGATSLRFGSNNTALTAGQLAKITVNGSGIWILNGSGYLVAASVASAYDTWAVAKGLTGLPGSATDPAKEADPDKDDRNNLGEFAFNGNPLSGSDNGKVFAVTEDSDFDEDVTKELILTVAVRSGTPAFTGSPLCASHPSDGITYCIEGSQDLASLPTAVNAVPTPVTNHLPAAGEGYEYRSFSLNGSNGLIGKGFLRAKVASP